MAIRSAAAPWAHLRLRDRIKPGVRVLFVGINPGVCSAQTGHHFAGYSNRFWKLLSESGLVPERISYVDDGRLPEWGFGITNLIARPSPGINDLRPSEYVEGWKALSSKVRRYRPEVLALVGVTVYRAVLPQLREAERGDGAPRATSLAGCRGPRHSRKDPATPRPRAIGPVVGPQPQILHGARVFVLPNPSGRNANFTYAEMLAAFTGLRTLLGSST
jgi:TDG/mug DNA glycosylase family protein